ncbi:MAG: hypothetical protein ACR2QC_10555 [Gammaproteobacteria bacterium]
MFTCIFRFNHPSHSCEGRNLIAVGGNCTITRRFAAAEIPAFAGMGRKKFAKKVKKFGFFTPVL